MVSAKRKRADDEAEMLTPRKLRARAENPQIEGSDEEDVEDVVQAETPSRRGRGLQAPDAGTPRSILKKPGILNGVHGGTPRSNRKLVFETPTKPGEDGTPDGTSTLVRNADRSARRKSNRKLIERTIHGDESDEEALDEEETLAQQILGDEEEDEKEASEPGPATAVPNTPTKRKPGRPKGSGKSPGRPRKARSPTPPQDLPPHEEYFYQNRPGANKTSNNTLPSHLLLNHDEYFSAMQDYTDPHAPEIEFLLDLHTRALDQWIFELEQGFNICLYGYGSKRPITERFAARLHAHLASQPPYGGTKKTPKIILVNGYAPATTLKEILTLLATTLLPANTKLRAQPPALLSLILSHLSSHPPAHPIPLIINSLDAPSLRRAPIPALLATLAAHPSINLLATVDSPNFALLWDVGLKAQYRFLFHDATTFAEYGAEMDVVESVNELLGRSGRRVGGRDGVGFVLRSLPENARSLFRILVTEQLSSLLMEEEIENEDPGSPTTPSKTPKSKPAKPKLNPKSKQKADGAVQGVEYRVLYHKAVEEFVCSSEVGFRTLLKEFHDHQMVESRRDGMGTEWLWVPFRREELEGLVEDLVEEGTF